MGSSKARKICWNISLPFLAFWRMDRGGDWWLAAHHQWRSGLFILHLHEWVLECSTGKSLCKVRKGLISLWWWCYMEKERSYLSLGMHSLPLNPRVKIGLHLTKISDISSALPLRTHGEQMNQLLLFLLNPRSPFRLLIWSSQGILIFF